MNNDPAALNNAQPLKNVPASKKDFIFPQETVDALQELGMIFRRTHERMVAEGYAIVDGKIVKADANQPDDNNRPNRKNTLKGDSWR
jgi:hypothetical protein